MKLNKTNIKKTFKGINSKVANISNGGCGIFALVLHDELKRIGIKSDIHIISSSALKVSLDYNVKTKNYGLLDEEGWNHIVLNVGGEWIDSDGVYTDIIKEAKAWYGDTIVLSDKISRKFLEGMLSECRWNDAFDREDVGMIVDLLVGEL